MSYISLFNCWGVSTHRCLHSCFGAGFAEHQQYFFRSNLYSSLLDRAQVLQRKGCRLDGVDVGPAAFRDVLVDALGLGDKPGGAIAGVDLLAHIEVGRSQRNLAMDQLRGALGSNGTDKRLPAFLFAGFGIFGMAATLEKRCNLACRSRARFPVLRSDDRTVAGQKL